MKNCIAIYSGTFDPLTYGHIDLIERASKLFKQLIIGVAESDKKKPLFSLQERIDLAKEVVSAYPNVKVKGFKGLLVNFAKEQNANVILRGLRVISDFDYECQMASTNRLLAENIETIFLVPADQYTYLSSSIVRELASFGTDVSKFVPDIIAKALKKKFP